MTSQDYAKAYTVADAYAVAAWDTYRAAVKTAEAARDVAEAATDAASSAYDTAYAIQTKRYPNDD